MKWINPKFPNKAYYISNGWAGHGHTVRQYNDGAPGSSLSLSYSEIQQFISRMKEHGWVNVGDKR